MRQALVWAGLAVAVLFLAGQFVRPPRTNPVIDSSNTLFHAVAPPADVQAIFDRACRDCHSNETRWPWYSNVAPVSWFVIGHVNHGRSHFNYSDWSQYPLAEADRLFEKTCTLARKRSMPLRSYTWMHREAWLTEADIEALCSWAEQQAR